MSRLSGLAGAFLIEAEQASEDLVVDPSAGSFSIETIVRVGYQLTERVHALAGPEGPEGRESAAEEGAAPPSG